ncbi:MAG TPA: tetratricopeptide repeat protein [Firmicutes bacterium]|nr:tetratricopeptide repeat protein [Candidatus Fermentithermobacillaceae bacterium]
MSSLEVFAKNVKTLMAQRNVRVKDLAERIGLSDTYLSLVLNGARRNLSDEYKDRIASFFNVPIARLFAEDGLTEENLSDISLYEDPHRLEIKGLIDLFIKKANLENRRTSFYMALSMLTDQDVRSVTYFLSRLLNEFEAEDQRQTAATQEALLSLLPAERELLALFSLAGNNARLDWVMAMTEMPADEFSRLTENLERRGLLSLLDDVSGKRINLKADLSPSISSIFSHEKIRLLHGRLSRAMEALPDQGPFFEMDLAQKMVKAGMSEDALLHFRKSARSFESLNLWDNAAKVWHEASVVYAALDNPKERIACVCEAIRCLGRAGNLNGAGEIGAYALKSLEDAGLSDLAGQVCLAMGNLYSEHDYARAVQWYKKGLSLTPEPLPTYGKLLINLASAYFGAGKLDQAENALKEAQRWSSDKEFAEARKVKSHIDLMLGLIEFQRRNWKASKTHFVSCIEKCPPEELDDLAVAWHNLGMLMYREDDTAMAREYLLKAQAIYEQKNLSTHWAYAAVELAKVYLREGKIEAAMSLLQKAAPVLNGKSHVETGWVFLLNACILSKQNRHKEVIDYAKRAIDLFQREGAERDLACGALWLSNYLEGIGDFHASRPFRNRAYQIYEKRHWDVRELHRECSLLSPKS